MDRGVKWATVPGVAKESVTTEHAKKDEDSLRFLFQNSTS